MFIELLIVHKTIPVDKRKGLCYADMILENNGKTIRSVR
jgi:hypothetical protein